MYLSVANRHLKKHRKKKRKDDRVSANDVYVHGIGFLTENNRRSTKMASSLLWLGRLGSFKALQRESWGLTAFCTKVEEPKKAVKKAKAAKAAAAPLAPAPEPFDNSTYKNLQHHNYNHYTFADLDLEMAKYRLPQPSSGRPSPRH
uniref:Uncharacterized protein n=1 Tax=Hucho hucho TaxID=62062 RepID=A0A4W5KLB5_9TELE